MKDVLGKFTLGIVSSVSISAMIFLINKTTPNYLWPHENR